MTGTIELIIIILLMVIQHGGDDVSCKRSIEFYFALFNTEQDALSFFGYINSQHPNIKFTMEREENDKLPFLDVLLETIAIRTLLPRCSGRRPPLVFSLIIMIFYLLVTN